MEISENDLNMLVPPTDAEIALLRMPAEERLPEYQQNSLQLGDDCPIEIKDLIRHNGLPASKSTIEI